MFIVPLPHHEIYQQCFCLLLVALHTLAMDSKEVSQESPDSGPRKP